MAVHDLRAQPIRSLYLLFQAVSTVFVRLPWWVLINIRRKDRPRTSWTLRKAVFLRLVRHLQGVSARYVIFPMDPNRSLIIRAGPAQ